jgi:ABC-type multidrug transport system ATPase subunit
MRILADVEKKAIAVTLYQAGNAIYDQFDKVLVIAEGECIYYGPREEAKGYFESLGLEMMGEHDYHASSSPVATMEISTMLTFCTSLCTLLLDGAK